jgi:hypothetical protein
MDSRRHRPYIHVTWITGLLAGKAKCEWAAWYRAHFRFAKRARPDEFNFDEWSEQHAEMIEARVRKLIADGWNVTIEDQNSFKLEGREATLSGTPDIVAVKGSDAVCYDEKGGEVRESNDWQVRTYMLALPLLFLKGKNLIGVVEYRGAAKKIDPLTPQERGRIVTTLQMVGGALEPPRVPSAGECRWCNVDACPDRVEVKEHVADASKIF